MAYRKTLTVTMLAAVLLGGCSFADQAFFPALSAEPTGSGGGTGQTATATSPAAAGDFAVPQVAPGQPTGTFVGQKVSNLRNDLVQLQTTLNGQNDKLRQLQNQTVQDSQGYHGTVAAIQSRLQVGTTPGNPVLVQQWNAAQGELDHIGEDVLQMNRLSTDVASTSGLAAYLLDSVRAARSLSGAVDEDHRQLRVLEDETNATILLIERLLTELSNDVQRQQSYIAAERNNLNTLALAVKNGQLYGASLANSRQGPSSTPASLPVASSERPLVVIHFDRANLNYEDALYSAVRGALDRRPTAVFEVVAQAPAGITPGAASLGESTARRNADAVARSLTQMGLPADRIRLSAGSGTSGGSAEVQVFVR